jgi:glycine betaine/proline transport system ATP-binding protein
MAPIKEDHFGGEVAHDATIEEIADRVEGSKLPHRVMCDGQVIGQIDSSSVVNILVGRN